MKERIIAICMGYLLDRLFGDPERIWHPIQGIGKCIEWTERFLWKLFLLNPKEEENRIKKRIAGVIFVFLVIGMVMGTTGILLYFWDKYCPWLKLILESVMCYQMLALHSLKKESMKVYTALKSEGGEEQQLVEGRRMVARIVGRDTEYLTREGVVKATVETIAENTSDGVIAPLFYMYLFGPMGGLFYKTVNTMDSMVAYKNERYRYFGTMAAKMDDVVNLIPARLSAIFLLAACWLTGEDYGNGWRIFKRDRYQHESPNSAQTESVCAGALHIQLAGPAYYFGRRVDKPSIGEADRQIEEDDIKRTNVLLEGAANLFFVTSVVVMMILYLKFGL